MLSYDAPTYWGNLLSRACNLQAVGWPNLSLSFNAWQYRARRAAVKELIKQTHGLDVLDVGCGTGYWIELWQQLNAASISGIDLTYQSIKHVLSCFPGGKFAQCDVADGVPFNGPFDLISAVDVLLHITDDQRCESALRHLRNVTTPGGRLLLIEPVTFGEHIPFALGATSRARSLVSLRSMLARTHWEIRTVRPALWLLNNPVETTPAAICLALGLQWSIIERLARAEASGAFVGAILYPLDRLLCRSTWGPTSKLVLAVATE